MHKRTIARAAAAGVAAILVLGAPLAASAHVAVSPDTATPGQDVTVTFRVPNESATAGTVKVEIDLPTKTPFAGAEYEPVAGWSAQVTTAQLARPITSDGVQITEAPTRVVFTANPGVQIGEGQFQEFTIALDVTPRTGSVVFPTRQSYSDGTVVAWDEPTPASGVEPEHPAPTLYITATPPGGGHHAGPEVSSAPSAVADDGTAGAALILGSAGLAVGVIALVLALFALLRTRRT